MNKQNEQMLTEYLMAAMTSGIKQTGATYQLPESMALEYGRLAYNQAIKDIMSMCKMSNFGQPGLELSDAIVDLIIHQRRTA
jgi:hypothetical protein